ncbi:hypothetical protein K432DRAFT_69907 [Lepidopterella palustris CBS 459.81]|uniref:Uncharacterized protein n=1 Tax=Lepidopterella palustris CBS 459.81 TaxID=1314670 RepID=A0A8E2J8I2_9PEZI|nr:hypothetical protein K432DRAFT_69907 [Lepidopterella palustris CBS 459.81]
MDTNSLTLLRELTAQLADLKASNKALTKALAKQEARHTESIATLRAKWNELQKSPPPVLVNMQDPPSSTL